MSSNSSRGAGRRPRHVLLGLCLLAGSLALAGCGGDEKAKADVAPRASADAALAKRVPAAIASDDKITFGTDASYAPSEFFDPDGRTIRGFDVDLGKAIAEKLGLEADFQNAPFDAIIPGVTKSGKFELGMSSFTINTDRVEQVDMVSYFAAGTAWAVPAGNPDSIRPDDACGRKVAVQKASVQVDDVEARSAECEKQGKDPITVEQYQLQADATTAVVTGKDDAMLADSPVVAYAIKQTNGKLEPSGSLYDSAPYGIIVPKGQSQLAEAIRDAVKALIEDGSYTDILEQWGVAAGAVTTPEINPSLS